MPEENLLPCAYHVVRYQPNLIRDEWVNIGVLLFDPGSGRVRQRWLDDPADLARLRRLHPAADEELLLRLPAEFDRQFAGRTLDAETILAKFDETLSNALQLSPRKGVLSRDPDSELDRVFQEQVEPARAARRGTLAIGTRGDLRHNAEEYFRSAKILQFMQRAVRVEEFTVPGDPMRIDFSYRRNGTRGFVHAVALGRDPGQAKLLAFTAEAIKRRVAHAEFLAVIEREPAPGNPRDQFVKDVLTQNDVRVLALPDLRKWAQDVAPVLRAYSGNS